MTSQPMQDWLAWVIIGWEIVGGLWTVLDETREIIWRSTFYAVVAHAFLVVTLSAAIASVI